MFILKSLSFPCRNCFEDNQLHFQKYKHKIRTTNKLSFWNKKKHNSSLLLLKSNFLWRFNDMGIRGKCQHAKIQFKFWKPDVYAVLQNITAKIRFYLVFLFVFSYIFCIALHNALQLAFINILTIKLFVRLTADYWAISNRNM